MMRRTRWRILPFLAAGFLIAGGALAAHKSGLRNLASDDASTCAGAHCTTTATFVKRQGQDFHVAQIVASMDTIIFNPRGTSGQPPPIPTGENALIDVTSTGEAGRIAAHLWDTPAITFLADGIVNIDMAGVASCELERFLAHPGKILCNTKPVNLLELDIQGQYGDRWTARLDADGDGTYETPTTAVECATNSTGTLGTCTSTNAIAGRTVLVTLERTVSNLRWLNGSTPVVSEAKKSGDFNEWDAGNPYPIVMTSSVLVSYTPLPDLVVDSIRVLPVGYLAGQTATIEAVARNASTGTTPREFQTRFRVDLQRDGTWDVNQTVTTGPLAANATETETVQWTAVRGQHTIEVCADMPPEPNGVIVEVAEGAASNCRMLPIQVLPDLVTDTITWAPPQPAGGEPVSFAAIVRNLIPTVQNDGGAVANVDQPVGTGLPCTPGPDEFCTSIRVDANQDGTWDRLTNGQDVSYVATPVLQPGESTTVSFPNVWRAIPTAGGLPLARAQVCADRPRRPTLTSEPIGAVRERNELGDANCDNAFVNALIPRIPGPEFRERR